MKKFAVTPRNGLPSLCKLNEASSTEDSKYTETFSAALETRHALDVIKKMLYLIFQNKILVEWDCMKRKGRNGYGLFRVFICRKWKSII